ncbi:hypothetical protein ABIB25_002065 [Nakamurella sp. UYEF19]|uniref:hypothetical protein n=1 Tax=Nakamurella sp. UYEF19 TaxID=1756392 RepID=UPI00339291F8
MLRGSSLLRELASAVRRPFHRIPAFGALALVVILIGFAGYRTFFVPTDRATGFPQSAAMEDQLGVRFSRVAVVGDGGLVTVTYVVLDSEKAGRFQSDVAHPPALVSEARPEKTTRVSLMKQGHLLRTGQTYYLVYQNTRAALRPGELATIAEGGIQLPHVPVL